MTSGIKDKVVVITGARVDVMINNAGLMQQTPLERLKVDEWDNMVDVNIKGVIYGIAAALPHMQRQKSGHIINVSSVAGHKVTPAGTVYSATKHAVRAISEGLMQEVSERRSSHQEPWLPSCLVTLQTRTQPGTSSSSTPGSQFLPTRSHAQLPLP